MDSQKLETQLKRDSTAKAGVRPTESYSILNIVGLMILHYSTLTIHTKTKEGFNGKDGQHLFSIMLFLTRYYLHRNKTNKTRQRSTFQFIMHLLFIWTKWVIIESSTLLYNRIIRVDIVYLKDLKKLLSIMFNMLWWKW